MQKQDNSPEQKSKQFGLVYLEDIKRLQDSTKSELIVWLVYSYHCNGKNNLCFPSIRTTMEMTSLSRPSVLRAIKALKKKGILIPHSTTASGVVKYVLSRITDDTPPVSQMTPPSIAIDTPLVSQVTPPSVIGDTTPVSTVIPRTAKMNIEINIASAASSDEKLFVLLWEKWSGNPLCLWQSVDPLSEYRGIRASINKTWLEKQYSKSLDYELQMIDIYLMQSKVSICGDTEYEGSPRLWPRHKWSGGIQKWLASSTTSTLTNARKAFIPYCIKLDAPAEPEREEQLVKDTNTDDAYIMQLEAMYDRCEGQNSDEGYYMLRELFIEHYNATPFPDSCRQNDFFYEYFYIIDSEIGGQNG